MRVDRRVMIGGAALAGSMAVIYAVTRLLPTGSLTRAAIADIYMPLLEAPALVLACLALRKNAHGPNRWTWVFFSLWLAANLAGDTAWAWYEVVLRTPPPTPSPADVAYLISYPLGFLTVVFTTWRASGRLRAVESALDALMLTLGLGGLGWPLLLAPLLHSSSHDLAGLISLAYPLGDLIVIVAFASVLLSSSHQRPPQFLFVVWAAFVVQVIADSSYFLAMVRTGGYTSGETLGVFWALVFVLAGMAALMELYPGAQPASAEREPARARSGRHHFTPTYPRMLLPYLAVPTAGALIWIQFSRFGAVWNMDMQVLIYAGIGLVVLLVLRQLVTLLHNRTLTAGLSGLSRELSDRVHLLAGVTDRLGELNAGAVRLNSLRAPSEIMRWGLELACSVTKSPAAWIALKDDKGKLAVAATFGPEEMLPTVGSAPGAFVGAEQRRLEEVDLEARGEKIGSLWLVRPDVDEKGPDLVGAVGAQLATAIDNTRRYEEVLQLAERDPLTGLFNHRGIHQRLAVEGRRAQQRGGQLSLVMIDLDDFKLLNDTYGHPAGDKVLSQVSETIRGVLRHTDVAGRVGGDEMMLVLPDTDREGAMLMAERLREALSSKPFIAGKNRGIPLRLSLGVATYPTDADTLTGLVGVADASLYASKQRGGDTITEAGEPKEPEAEDSGLRGIAGRLMDVVGARDHYTRRHADRVTAHALSLGDSLGLSGDSLDTLKLAAMLHDVGKLGLGPRVLRKPAPLTADEERSVRRHVDIGETIIRDLPRVAEVLEAVHAHHERYDGSGYPSGLLGEDIPLLARILAIADAYAAMTVDRPYRAKVTAEQARQELQKVAGSQLDPELVARFVDILESQAPSRFAAAG